MRSPGPSGHRRRPLATALVGLLAVAGLLGLAGCSKDDGGSSDSDATTTSLAQVTTTTRPPWNPDEAPTEAEYVDALGTGLTAGEASGGDLVLTKDEAACVAPAWIRTMTVGALHEAQFRAKDLEDPAFNYTAVHLDATAATAMVTALHTCGVDVRAKVVDLLSPGVAAENRACAEKKVTAALADQVMAAGLTDAQPSTELSNTVFDLKTECGLG